MTSNSPVEFTGNFKFSGKFEVICQKVTCWLYPVTYCISNEYIKVLHKQEPKNQNHTKFKETPNHRRLLMLIKNISNSNQNGIFLVQKRINQIFKSPSNISSNFSI